MTRDDLTKVKWMKEQGEGKVLKDLPIDEGTRLVRAHADFREL